MSADHGRGAAVPPRRGVDGAAGTPRGSGAPSRVADLRAVDGTRVSAAYDAPAPDADPGLAFVVAHGFSGSWRRPDVRRVVDALSSTGGVVSLDLRGHGRSSGVSTLGDREPLDLDAAVAWARSLGYTRVVTIGFSMGASVALRHAGLHGEPAAEGHDSGLPLTPDCGADAVVAVSGTAFWFYRGTAPMRLLHRVVERPELRAAAQAWRGVRIGSTPWDPDDLPLTPTQCAARLAVPLLVVHGTADRYFPLEHPRAIAAAARSAGRGVDLWEEPGMGHAEAAATPELVGRIALWAVTPSTFAVDRRVLGDAWGLAGSDGARS